MAKNTVTKTETPITDDITSMPDLPDVSQKDDSFVGETEHTDGDEQDPVDTEKHRGTLSTCGDVYDPSLHTYPPKETITGKWRKQGGRGKGKKSDGAPLSPNADYRQAATQTAMLYAQLNRAVMGDGAEIVRDEVVPMIDAWETYYNANGLRELPPWLAVTLASGMYSYSVATRPKVKNRVAGFFLKLAVAIKLIKPKKQETRDDAHVDSRD